MRPTGKRSSLPATASEGSGPISITYLAGRRSSFICCLTFAKPHPTFAPSALFSPSLGRVGVRVGGWGEGQSRRRVYSCGRRGASLARGPSHRHHLLALHREVVRLR